MAYQEKSVVLGGGCRGHESCRSRLGSFLTTSVAALTIATAVAFGAPGNAWADPVDLREINIPAQPVGAALKEFARQTDIEVLFAGKDVARLRSKAVSGAATREEAIGELLAGTGLVFEFEGNDLLIVRVPADPNSKIDPVRTNSRSPGGNAKRLADADAGATAGRSDEDEDEEDNVEEIIVTGSHIRGVKDMAAPTITFTRDEIEKAGFSTIGEVFASLPQNLGEVRPSALRAEGTSLTSSENTAMATGISLRGLGPQSTLVLLNGRRRAGNINGRAFDISAIPLAVIERIEIVTGGRSAVYGSDAVAGVVNLVTRRDFEGAETQIYFGNSGHGGDRFNVSQIFGRSFDKGGFVVAYDYARNWSLDATEASRVSDPPTGTIEPIPGALHLSPDSKRHSAFFSGQFKPNERAELYADALYTSDRNEALSSFILFSAFTFDGFTAISSDQYSATAGARFDVNGSWQVDVSGTHSVVDNHLTGFSNSVFGDFPFGSDDMAKQAQFTAVADGPLLSVGGVEVLAAVGVESRDESYKLINAITGLGLGSGDRVVRSAFGELIVPLRSGDAKGGVRSLEVSLAARYDDYSDFGGTFDPQIGVQWGPVPGLVLRGALSTAFRAPDLILLDAVSQINLRNLSDPAAPGGISTVLEWTAGNPDLGPEEATTWSMGFDYEPVFATWAKISLSYYHIEYTGRLDTPATGPDRLTVFENLDALGSFVDRSPSAEELAAILDSANAIVTRNTTGTPFDPATQNLLDAYPDLVVFDNRTANIGAETVSGIDLDIDANFETDAGVFGAGLNGTYYLKLDRRNTPTASTFSQLNRQGKPTDLRLRASASWTKSAYGAFVYVNYIDGYNNTLTSPASRVESWTTVDVTLHFDGSKLLNGGGALKNFSVALSVSNLFNQDPPELLNNPFGLNFDGANANPLGRLIGFNITKRW